MREIERLKQTILAEYPRMSPDSQFHFRCHPGVACFNACCGDVNIFLTPYDIVRLKNNLHISSGEFLSRYTVSPFDENLKYPVVLLKMEDDEKKRCPFVGEQGCRVYNDRPWACRMYPLGLASPKEETEGGSGEFYFLLKENICKGHDEPMELTVNQWLIDQGITEYNVQGEYFKDITLNPFFLSSGTGKNGRGLTPQKVDMFHMVCYDVDRFRRFLFESTFFDKFIVDSDIQEKIAHDDVELLKFGYQWLKFGLFNEKTLVIRSDVVREKLKSMSKGEVNG